jgi:hypothetical protein
MDNKKSNVSEKKRLTRTQKEANNFAWYKEKVEQFDIGPQTVHAENGKPSDRKRMQVNFDLMNNKLNIEDLEYVCRPFGSEVGELPATMMNRDIISSRTKAMEGMEMKRPFNFKVLATNRDATTRKEEEETNRIREYVISEIVGPIRKEKELKYAEQTRGRQLSEREQQEINDAIEQEVQAATPDRVRRYMERKHQDPAEVMHHQLSQYLIKKEDLKRKFNKGWKYSMGSGYDLYWVGILKGKPRVKNINPMYFRSDPAPDHDFVQQGEWATYENWMYPSEVIRSFDLDDDEIDKIYSRYGRFASDQSNEDLFRYIDNNDINIKNPGLVRVLHTVWKDLRKMGFLTYYDETETLQMDIVDESYVFDPDNGDVNLEWEWIPETYETYKISSDIYKNMQAVPGRYYDLDNLYECNLPYYGHRMDNMNSEVTCPVDRMVPYQYWVNIFSYRLEMLLASDKGKKILMNINAIPESSGMDIEKWQYFFESTPFMWYNPNEEGVGYSDVNTLAKELDLSLVSDIGKYIDLILSLDEACGKSVGLNDAVLGQIAPSAEVGNTKQQIVQTSYILEPYFDMHNHTKKNVLQALIEAAKVAYRENPPGALSYIWDDMSIRTFEVDQGMLEASGIGLFVEDSSDASEIKETLKTFAHAALQNQKAELSDVLSIARQEGSQEAEEILRAAEEKRRQDEFGEAERKRKADAEEAQKQRDHQKEQWAHDLNKIKLTEKLKTEREIKKQLILSAGFNEDKDLDNDGILDIVELARDSSNAQIEARKQNLEERKFEHQKTMDKKELQQKKKEKSSK